MSQHKVKQVHETAARLRDLAQAEFMVSVRKSNIWQRIKFCMKVLFG